MLKSLDTVIYRTNQSRFDNSFKRQLIKEAVIIQDVPFVRIEEVVACKTDYDREKDRVDIDSIQKIGINMLSLSSFQCTYIIRLFLFEDTKR